MIRVVKMSFEYEQAEAFKKKFDDIKLNILSCPGCISLRLIQDRKDKGVFFTISEWEDEDHLNDYRDSALFKTTWNFIKPWFKSKPQAWSTDQIFSSK